jgi:hypothetical protein
MKLYRITLLFLTILWSFTGLISQMVINGENFNGSEWLRGKEIIASIPIAQDGAFRIGQASLNQLGQGSVPLENWGLFLNGVEVPMWASTNGVPSSGDHMIFRGEKNKGYFDSFLFNNPQDQLNSEYSMYTDTAKYYLVKLAGKGKRISNLTIPGSSNKLSELSTSANLVFSSKYASKKPELTGTDIIYSSDYTTGDGYSTEFSLNHNIPVSLQGLSRLPSKMVSLHIRMCSYYFVKINSFQPKITLNNQVIYSAPLGAFTILDTILKVPASVFTGNDTLKFRGIAGDNDNYKIAFIKAQYEIENGTNVFKDTWKVPANKNGIFELKGTSYVQNEKYHLWNLDENTSTINTANAGSLDVYLQSQNKSDYFLFNEKNISDAALIPENRILPISGDLNTDYLILTSKKLHPSGSTVSNNVIEEYAEYRKSNQGGNYSVKILHIEDIYHQFGFGIERHPQSIRNFNYWAKTNFPRLSYVFIIGKGREFNNSRTRNQLVGTINTIPLHVPTFGNPGSDNLLFAPNGRTAPDYSIGRLSCSNLEEVNDYFQKVKALEASPDPGNDPNLPINWRKRFIHLSGGKGLGEQSSLAFYMNDLKATLIRGKIGASVTSFYKTSSAAVDEIPIKEVSIEANKGVSMISFMGHSAVSTVDINFDNPDLLVPGDRYPVILSMGCFSGNIHSEIESIGEKFSFAKNKGSVGFLATTGFGFPDALFAYGNGLYNSISENLGKPIGLHTKNSLYSFDTILVRYPFSSSIKTLAHQMTFHGDPGLVIGIKSGRDFTPDNSFISVNPENPTIGSDSIVVQVKVLNNGIYNATDTLEISLVREFPNGNREVLPTVTLPSQPFSLTFPVKLLVSNFASIGQNYLHVEVNPNRKIIEDASPIAKTNNIFKSQNGVEGIPFFVKGAGAQTAYPGNYAIIEAINPELIALTSDPLGGTNEYLMEIDTTDLFNSPRLKKTKVVTEGGSIKWKILDPLKNNTVYYWRVAASDTSKILWSSSSFLVDTFLKYGWNQSHYYQFGNNRLNDFVANDLTRNYDFVEKELSVKVDNAVNGYPFGVYFLGGNRIERVWYGMPPGLFVGVIDPSNLKAWSFNPLRPMGAHSSSSGIGANRCFVFPDKTQQDRKAFINFIKDSIPDGFLVVINTIQYDTIFLQERIGALPQWGSGYNSKDWGLDSVAFGTSIFKELEKHGAKSVRQLAKYPVPYSFFFKKGGEVYFENIAESDNPGLILSNQQTFKRRIFEANMITDPIGPLKSMNKLEVKLNGKNKEINDNTEVTVFGLKVNSTMDSLFSFKGDTNMFLNQNILADYPRLKLRFYSEDPTLFTSENVAYWRVIGQPLPDLVPIKGTDFTFNSDTLVQGDNFQISMGVENISPVNIGASKVKISLRDSKNKLVETFVNIPALSANSRVNFSAKLPTNELSGSCRLAVTVNSESNPLESNFVNNILARSVFIKRDNINPLMTVTFDGRILKDGETVNKNVRIVARILDMNPFSILNDTSLYNVFLSKENSNGFLEENKVFWRGSKLKLEGNNTSSNKANIVFLPGPLSPGNYALRISASDNSGNTSGSLDYFINFKVQRNIEISVVRAMPNPFSFETQFVYTLTGEPAYGEISIMDVLGNVLLQKDLGELVVGENQPAFVWNGTNNEGNPVSNGMYFYKITAKDKAGKEIQRVGNTGDQGVSVSGWGKVFFIR